MSFRFRMYPNTEQEAVMRMHCDHARAVWNAALIDGDMAGTFGQHLVERMRMWDRRLTEARADLPWLKAGSSTVQQAALRDLRQAWVNRFKRPDHFGRPTFRSAKASTQGFVVRDVKWRRLNKSWAEINVPKCGPVRFRISQPIGKHGAARVTLDRAGRWHVAFVAALEQIDRERTGAICGIDRGVANTLAFNNGRMMQAPGLSEGEQAEFVRRMVERSTMPKSDPMREVHRKAISRTYARLADRRKDWVEQTTTELVREFDVIVVEHLNIKGMVRKPKPKPDPDQPGQFLPNGARAKAGLNRAILAQCWGMFLQRLKAKAALCGVEVVEVDARNTSRRCNECGHVSAGNRENQACFQCLSCGHEAHADTNAAKNILDRWPGHGQNQQVAA